jgi:orotidine-5'-phosphate decarboxylase
LIPSGGRFADKLELCSKKKRSKIILALDLDYRTNTHSLLSDAIELVGETSDSICAVKINFHLLLPLSMSEITRLNGVIRKRGLVSIADIKLNDIDNTNRVTTRYLWDSGFSAVIANPFVGFEGALDVVFKQARERGKGVILLGYMSHRGADEGYGLKLYNGRTIFREFLERAKNWKADGMILGSTRPEKIVEARKVLGPRVKLICPGSGAQGGNSVESLKAGADYLIYGRAIVQSKNPGEAAKDILRSLSSIAKN